MPKKSVNNKIINSLLLTLVIYGFLGWLYIILVALVHPETLSTQLYHLTPWLKEGDFGVLSFIVSGIAFFLWKTRK